MPDSPFDPSQLSPAIFDFTIRSLEDEEATLAAKLARVRDQLEWWQKGRLLFASDSEDARQTTDSPPSAKPSLRRAIVRVMLDKPPVDGLEQHWPSKEVIAEIERRGWLPGGKNPQNLVRRMLRAMAEDDGPLVKPEYGTFALAPSVRDGENRQLVGEVDL